jgi:predicted  nucleic acid-binding Zn-ribbon protein
LNAKVKALVDLERVDTDILELARAGEAHPQRLAELDRKLDQAKAALENEQQRLAANEKQRRDIESQVQHEKDTIKKWEGRLSELRTPREYAALSREIDIAKKSVENLEQQNIELRATAEPIKQAIDHRQKELLTQHETVGVEARDIRAKMSSLKDRLDALEGQRNEARRMVDAVLLSRYETIRKKRGVALVPVQGGTCRGCHMSLPPQLFNLLWSGQIEIETCPSCHRLVYAPDPAPETTSN